MQSQLQDSQQLNQTLKDSVLEMKKEQRLVLDELETQLSSLIEEKQTLEERQGVISHFLVSKPLTFKTRLRATMSCCFFGMRIRNHFHINSSLART